MGIFNSKNLKKAVNMVASSSPVINAISQATDIVDKSMDVIDKNLNGGKNWNFSETPKDEVAKAFMNGVRGKHIVCMMTNISDTAKASIRDNWNTTMTTVIDEIWNLIKELYSDMIKP